MKDISFLVLSCDKYNDLWKDFFLLKDHFWSDCPFDWFIVTESSDFEYKDVKIIKCGNKLNWTGRLKYALKVINTEYICFFLDDFFINNTIDNQLILRLIDYAKEIKSDYFVLGDAFSRKFVNPDYRTEHIINIPYNREYGIDTSVAIWKSEFLLSLLDNDCSAWQFELDRLKEARNGMHKGRILLYDDRKPLNISDIPIVIQGKFYPKSIIDFRKRGFEISTSDRPTMTKYETLRYDLKVKMSKIKTGKFIVKWLASKFLGYRFFTPS